MLRTLEACVGNHQFSISVGVGVHWLWLTEDRGGGCPSTPSSSTLGCKSDSQGCRAPDLVSRSSKGAQLRGRSWEGLEMGEGCSACALDSRWGKGSSQSPWEGAQMTKEHICQDLLGAGSRLTDLLSLGTSPCGPDFSSGMHSGTQQASSGVPFECRMDNRSHLSEREQGWCLASGGAWRGHLGEKPDPQMCPVQWRHKASNSQAAG